MTRKNTINIDRLRALQRVEQYIVDHPGSNAREIGGALAIKPTTLNSYTLQLRELGRLTKTTHRRASGLGSLPDTYQVPQGLQPLPVDAPMPLPVKAENPIKVGPQRMDIVAALFGPAERITS
jgi:hypothetical protein